MKGQAYEQRDADPRYAVIGLASLVACVVVAVVVAGLFVLATGKGGAPFASGRALAPPPPRLEVTAGATLAEVQRRGDARLSSWGWADRPAGLAHMPIDRAMELTAARGWAGAKP